MHNIFTIHNYVIEVKEINKPHYLLPFGDIHRFASLCDVPKWKEFLGWSKLKERTHFLGMGDYDDLCSTSERKILNSNELHDFSREALDEVYQKRSDDLIDEIRFMNIIGLLEGNHFGLFSSSNITTTQYMCQKLGCKYLGVSAFIRLTFIYGKKHACIDVWVHHGKSGSRLVGGSMNAVQNMADIADADVYLCGHDHKKSIAMKTRLCLTHGIGLNLTHKKILMGRTGSFLRGYVPEKPSYIAKALLSPTDLGVLKIELTPKRTTFTHNGKKEDSFYVDLHGSL